MTMKHPLRHICRGQGCKKDTIIGRPLEKGWGVIEIALPEGEGITALFCSPACAVSTLNQLASTLAKTMAERARKA